MVKSGLPKFFKFPCLVAMAMAIAGCSSTLVVLVPDPSGKVGEVSVTTATGTQVLRAPGESTATSRITSSLTETEVLTEERIQNVFGSALANEPLPPERHTLYFHFDTTILQPQSQRELSRIYQAIVKRPVCDVSINGHTDRMGTKPYNYHLSMQRALRVQRELIDLGLKQTCLKIRYYGESAPLIPTADGIAEQMNRRVEIEIH
jgi:outer membrane protein OmpA-like peptidoglycan-associated protein